VNLSVAGALATATDAAMAPIHIIISLSVFLGASVQAVIVQTESTFTQNALCSTNKCINPVFPGLNDLPRLEQVVWQGADHATTSRYMDFCKAVVNYDPALPSPNSTSQPMSEVVKQQENAAITMYFYHLSGLGYEAGEYRRPGSSSDACVKQVWRMVCFTYFPKVESGCKPGEPTPYLRPCRDTCENYIKACAVECCDESVQCVFEHTIVEAGIKTKKVQTGYVNADGPSATCTGMSSSGRRNELPWALTLIMMTFQLGSLFVESDRSRASSSSSKKEPSFRSMGRSLKTAASSVSAAIRKLPSRAMLLAAVLIPLSLSIQGCLVIDVPLHAVGNWRKQPDYLVKYDFVPLGQPPSAAVLNSCSSAVPQTQQCSGRGYCKEWNASAADPHTLSFCECDRDWTDPECRTRRKSQTTTFLLALFGGFVGADLFYLGYIGLGLLKMVTLGGCGVWWALDLIRTGSGPVYAFNYRVANDLPHWVFVLSTVTIFILLGFVWSLESYFSYRKRKRQDLRKLQEAEEARQFGVPSDMLDGPRNRMGGHCRNFVERREFGGYGATVPMPMPNAGAPTVRRVFG